jgi:hypothetical protein
MAKCHRFVANCCCLSRLDAARRNAQAVAPSPYTSYIGDTLNFVGNAELVINNSTDLTAVPIPGALYVQTNGTPALTQ